MNIETADFTSRVRVLLQQQGVAVSEEELSRLEARYRECGGTDLWDVRAYAASGGLGARSYHVVRGTGVVDVYRSAERDNAAAVRTALNDLELRGQTPATTA